MQSCRLTAQKYKVVTGNPGVEPDGFRAVSGSLEEAPDLPLGIQPAVKVMVADGTQNRRQSVARLRDEPVECLILGNLPVVSNVSVDENPHTVRGNRPDVRQRLGKVLVVQVVIRGIDMDVTHDLHLAQQGTGIKIRRAGRQERLRAVRRAGTPPLRKNKQTVGSSRDQGVVRQPGGRGSARAGKGRRRAPAGNTPSAFAQYAT